MPSQGPDIFDKLRLPPELDAYLRQINPWWEGKPARALPGYRRWAFDILLRKLHSRLAPAIVLRGARQVGKTTLQEQIIEQLLKVEAVDPRRVLLVQFDEIPTLGALKEPVLAIARWYENRILGQTFNEAAHAGKPAYVFLDEVQNLTDWAPQLKALVDHHTLHVVVTGSSALCIEVGRDSLAGRITTMELGTLLLREEKKCSKSSTSYPQISMIFTLASIPTKPTYGYLRSDGPDKADEAFGKALQVVGVIETMDSQFVKRVGRWKVDYRLGLGDAFAAASAEEYGCPLVTTDRNDFAAVESAGALQILWLR